MTNPMLAELDEVVRLMDSATPGEWRSRPEHAVVILGGNRGGFCIEHCPDASGNTSLIAAAVNFLRTHHATLADMAKRLEAAERDARRWRHARKLLTADDIEGAQGSYDSFGGIVSEDECKRADAAIDAATQEGEG